MNFIIVFPKPPLISLAFYFLVGLVGTSASHGSLVLDCLIFANLIKTSYFLIRETYLKNIE